MAEKGWIKLHRRLLDCWIWDVKPFDKGRAWVDLLLLAMHHDKKIVIEDKPTIISRGSYFTSRGQLADRWGWSVKKVDTYLKTLEKEEMVTTHRTPKGTTITIVNYEEYQIEGTTKDTTEDTTVDIQNKNVKNIKNIYMSENSDDKEQSDTLQSDFQIIYKSYPKKVGKTKGFEYYKAWVTKGRVISGVRRKLTNKQIWDAIAKYKREMDDKCTELEYYKNFDTFMNKAILDYVEE